MKLSYQQFSRRLRGCSLTPKSSRATMRVSLWLPRSCCSCSLRLKLLRTVKRWSRTVKRWSLQQVARLPCALHFAPKELKNNHDFVLAAFSNNPVGAVRFASKELRSNHEFVMTLFSKNPAGALYFASRELRNSYDFIMALVSQNQLDLPSAFEELRGNNNIVVSNELQKDLLWFWRFPLVTLNVGLLSGRCSSILFPVHSSLHAVLLECAGRLRLDPHQVTATGVLLSGS